MKTNFWKNLSAPIIALSPMDGITDQPYRYIQKKYGNPDIIYTEFTNVEGVCHGALRLLEDFLYDETQRPIVAQIYGTTPKYFRQVAVILCELGFDGIDINMGCPAKSVDSSGAGAALIKTPELAQDIIKETKAGVEDYRGGTRAKDCPDISKAIVNEVETRHEKLSNEYKQDREIPVSVKTRIGYNQPVVETWIPTLIEMMPAAIGIHGRTLKQQYSGKADWNEIKKAAKLCKDAGIPILGNGDVLTKDQAAEYINKYQVDGVLIGRGSFGNPFAFSDNSEQAFMQALESKDIFKIALEHCRYFEKTYSHDPRYQFMPMRKHLGWYVKGIVGARDIRVKLFQTNSPLDVETIFKEYNLI